MLENSASHFCACKLPRKLTRVPDHSAPQPSLNLSCAYRPSLQLRPELAAVADGIATWADRFSPPAGELRNPLIDDHPYLVS